MGKAKLIHLPILARPGFISVHGSPFLKQVLIRPVPSILHVLSSFIEVPRNLG